jgi:hypothetical protein
MAGGDATPQHLGRHRRRRGLSQYRPSYLRRQSRFGMIVWSFPVENASGERRS